MTIHPPGLGVLAGRRFAAVLFDLDGTLIDSTPAVLASWQEWADRRGLRPPEHIPHGVPARQVLVDLVPGDQVEQALAQLERIESTRLAGIRVLPGAERALAAPPSDRVAIVTSGTLPLARARTGAVGLSVPAVLVTANDVEVGKPDPAPFLLAARRLGVAAADCLVVEDAPAGLRAGRAAGCVTLAVTTTYPAGELDADAVADSLADVELVAEEGLVAVRPSSLQ